MSAFFEQKMGLENINTGMKPLIKVINELHDATTTTGASFQLDLPQIAVVGGQSAGKSSVLENIAGRDFLPRGSDIVTRRPLVLQMRHHHEEYAEFLHKPGVKFTDNDEIRREIQDETDRVAKGKNVSDVPVNLKLYSPHVVDLTLVDLPGLTKNAIADQDPDIVHQIRDMVIQYIQPENTIILAVSPANQDIATSDAIQVAQLVDPNRDRTIGVLTKLDLMDAGTDAQGILENKTLPLKKGYIGVVNRSQRDIYNNKRIEDALEDENRFFRSHPSYSLSLPIKLAKFHRHMADRMGTKCLQETLNGMLYAHLKERLPGIRSQLRERRGQLKEQLEELGGVTENLLPPSTQLILHLSKFADFMEKEIHGYRPDVDVHEMSIGVMINQAYYEEISNFFDLGMRPDHETILKAVSNLHGIHNSMFPADQVVKMTVENLVNGYKEPMRLSAALIATLLRTLVEKAVKELEVVPKLQEEVVALMCEKIHEYQQCARNQLMSYVDCEASFINTKHPDFRFNNAEAISKELREQVGSAAASPAPHRKSSSATCLNQLKPQTSLYQQSDSTHPPQRLHTGTMKARFHPASSTLFKRWKELYFVLTSNALSWYKNQKESNPEGYFTITADIVCRSLPDGKGFIQFTFRRSAGGALWSTDVEVIDVMPVRRDESEIWLGKLQETSMKLERAAAGSSLTMKQTVPLETTDLDDFSMVSITSETRWEKKVDWITSLRRNPSTMGTANAVGAMVEEYMLIVDKTVRDLTPKYLTHFLVNKTVAYAKKALHGDLVGSNNLEQRVTELLTADGFREKRARECFEVLQATEKALQILGSFPAEGSFE